MLSEKYSGVITFIKVDVDESREVSSKYEISAMPSFLLFKNGKKVATVVGADPGRLEAEVKNLV